VTLGQWSPVARVLPADCEGVIPASVITRVLPDPAGALMTETRLPSVSADSTAAA